MSSLKVYGDTIDTSSRCIHWNSEFDIISIKFNCCTKYYPCYLCHAKYETHSIKKWTEDSNVILCGTCKRELYISQYLRCNDKCIYCNSNFNKNCKKHYHIYFDDALLI